MISIATHNACHQAPRIQNLQIKNTPRRRTSQPAGKEGLSDASWRHLVVKRRRALQREGKWRDRGGERPARGRGSHDKAMFSRRFLSEGKEDAAGEDGMQRALDTGNKRRVWLGQIIYGECWTYGASR
jgi:hypothetical protein